MATVYYTRKLTVRRKGSTEEVRLQGNDSSRRGGYSSRTGTKFWKSSEELIRGSRRSRQISRRHYLLGHCWVRSSNPGLNGSQCSRKMPGKPPETLLYGRAAYESCDC